MTREDALGALLDQIKDLIAFAKEGEKDLFKHKMPSEVEERLEAVEAALKIFRLINDEALRLTGDSESKLDRVADEIPDYLDARQRSFLEKTKNLKNDIEGVQKRLDVYRREIQSRGIGKKKDKASKARKKRFRKLGGDKGWKPV